jgi:hypothetical protein
MNTVMPATMAIQRDRVSTMMNSVAKRETNMNNMTNMVTPGTMAVQRVIVSAVVSPVTKIKPAMTAVNVDPSVKLIMLVTMFMAPSSVTKITKVMNSLTMAMAV